MTYLPAFLTGLIIGSGVTILVMIIMAAGRDD